MMSEKKTDKQMSREQEVEIMRKNISQILDREIDKDKALNLLALIKVMEDLGVKPVERLAEELTEKLTQPDASLAATTAYIRPMVNPDSYDPYMDQPYHGIYYYDPLTDTGLSGKKKNIDATAIAVASAPDPDRALREHIYQASGLTKDHLELMRERRHRGHRDQAIYRSLVGGRVEITGSQYAAYIKSAMPEAVDESAPIAIKIEEASDSITGTFIKKKPKPKLFHTLAEIAGNLRRRARKKKDV